jgi:hypothetical protein
MDLERSEACAKTYVLIRGELLIPENQHGVTVVRLLDQRKGFGRQVLRKIDPCNFCSDRGSGGLDLDPALRHFLMLARSLFARQKLDKLRLKRENDYFCSVEHFHC